jgi:hypothetical protein
VTVSDVSMMGLVVFITKTIGLQACGGWLVLLKLNCMFLPQPVCGVWASQGRRLTCINDLDEGILGYARKGLSELLSCGMRT